MFVPALSGNQTAVFLSVDVEAGPEILNDRSTCRWISAARRNQDTVRPCL